MKVPKHVYLGKVGAWGWALDMGRISLFIVWQLYGGWMEGGHMMVYMVVTWWLYDGCQGGGGGHGNCMVVV